MLLLARVCCPKALVLLAYMAGLLWACQACNLDLDTPPIGCEWAVPEEPKYWTNDLEICLKAYPVDPERSQVMLQGQDACESTTCLVLQPGDTLAAVCYGWQLSGEVYAETYVEEVDCDYRCPE